MKKRNKINWMDRTVGLLYSVQNGGVPFAITNNLTNIAIFWKVDIENKTPDQIILEIWDKFDQATK